MVEKLEFSKALREARLASAAKLDAVLGVADARVLRLDALHAELEPVFAANSEAKDLFALNVQSGESPKLWLDLISSVVMEPDPRTYRLVQDQENRREVIFETSDIKAMSAYIVKYLAHRLVVHEKLARGVSPLSGKLQKPYSAIDLILVFVSGAAVGVLAFLIASMLLGRLSF